ncbi:MAG: RNA methyltransferase [Calditrichaeota bacterium]|nr:MAG: RNA methyltransferase [Calditrichota bacterium]
MILDAVESNKPPVFLTSERDFKKISNTAHAQGIGALLRFPQQALNADSLLNEKKGIVIAIDELNDPGNLGTIIRTAEWFGVTGMAIGKNTVAWHNDKVLRASMGAIFHLPFLEVEDFPMFLQKAKAAGFTLFAADQNGTTSLSNVQIPEKSILLLGDEAKGLSRQSRKAADEILAIEGKGKVESLNVASAAAILMAKFCEPGRS